MTIYNIFEHAQKEQSETAFQEKGPRIDPGAFSTNQIDENFIPKSAKSKDHIFSAIAARLFFFLLLVADVAWGIYSVIGGVIKFALCLATFFQFAPLVTSFSKTLLSIKRSIVCALSLIIAVFSPALGIMFSCLYFMMYDRKGIDEVVPTSLKDQFLELFPDMGLSAQK